MQKRFPSLSFCVGIAFGKRRAEAVVRWRAVRWCAVAWARGGVACGEVVCGGVGAWCAVVWARGARCGGVVVAFAETEVRVEISGDCGKST